MVKISIITVVYNGERYIRDCIESVLSQDYPNIEYLLLDGASTDQTFEIAKTYGDKMAVLRSESDKGMYDALNKGIKLATGEIVGILNADDILADQTVISRVAAIFNGSLIDGVYGDLNYVHPQKVEEVQREWRSKPSKPKDLTYGWMPAHPTLYLKKMLFEKWGGYSLNYGSAADYELMLRLLYKHRIKTQHLPVLMVKMRNGGMSNQSIKHRYEAFLNDYAALKNNEVPFPLLALLLKKLRKINQFL